MTDTASVTNNKQCEYYRWRDQRQALLSTNACPACRQYDAAAYASFRDTALQQAASEWAAAGAVAALQVLAAAYPRLLQGRLLLRVLELMPESLSPRMYAALLPKV